MRYCLILLILLPMVLVANVYTLDQLIEYGMENSFQIQKDELTKASSTSSLRSAKWNLMPNANITATMNQDLDPISGSSGLSNSVGFEISKTVSLNDPAYFSYRFARLDSETADLAMQRAYSSYAYSVFSAYIQALSATQQKEALEENLAIQNRVWEQSQVMQRLGKVTPFEVKQNEIAVMNSRISLIQLENSIENARANLFSLVQMEDQGYPLTDTEMDIAADAPDFDTGNILQIKILEQELKRHDININRTFLDHFPSVTLSYSYARDVRGADFDYDQYSTVHGINLRLSYSLWNFFTNGESATRYKINKDMAILNLADTRDQTRRDYDNTRQKLEYLQRLDELYSERLEQSREQIEIAQERYRLGLIQLLELDRSRTDYIEAEIEYSNNRYQIIQTQQELNFLLSNKILGKW